MSPAERRAMQKRAHEALARAKTSEQEFTCTAEAKVVADKAIARARVTSEIELMEDDSDD